MERKANEISILVDQISFFFPSKIFIFPSSVMAKTPTFPMIALHKERHVITSFIATKIYIGNICSIAFLDCFFFVVIVT